MSANADALRFPGDGGNRSKGFGIAAGLVIAVLVSVTLFVLATRHAAPSLDPVAPARGQHELNAVSGGIRAQGTVSRVGGTSIYRYHPLPGTNTVFDLTAPAAGQKGTSSAHIDPRVGGSSAYQYHSLP